MMPTRSWRSPAAGGRFKYTGGPLSERRAAYPARLLDLLGKIGRDGSRAALTLTCAPSGGHLPSQRKPADDADVVAVVEGVAPDGHAVGEEVGGGGCREWGIGLRSATFWGSCGRGFGKGDGNPEAAVFPFGAVGAGFVGFGGGAGLARGLRRASGGVQERAPGQGWRSRVWPVRALVRRMLQLIPVAIQFASGISDIKYSNPTNIHVKGAGLAPSFCKPKRTRLNFGTVKSRGQKETRIVEILAVRGGFWQFVRTLALLCRLVHCAYAAGRGSASLRRGMRLIAFPFSLRARSSSYAVCKFIQKSADMPKY